MKTLKKIAIYYACLPLDLLIAFPMVLLVRLLWGERLRWKEGVLSVLFRKESWALGGKTVESNGKLVFSSSFWWPKGFYLYNYRKSKSLDEKPISWGGTSIGHGHLYGPGNRNDFEEATSTEIHELHHTIQAEVAQLASMIISHWLFIVEFIRGDWISAVVYLGVVWLVCGWLLTGVCGWVIATLREHPNGFYRGSAHEIGAYAVGKLYRNSKQSLRG